MALNASDPKVKIYKTVPSEVVIPRPLGEVVAEAVTEHIAGKLDNSFSDGGFTTRRVKVDDTACPHCGKPEARLDHEQFGGGVTSVCRFCAKPWEI